MSYYWYLRNKETNEVVHIGQSAQSAASEPATIYSDCYINEFKSNGSDFEVISECESYRLDCIDVTPD